MLYQLAQGKPGVDPEGSKQPTGLTGLLRSWFDLDHTPESVQMTSLKSTRRESGFVSNMADVESERHLYVSY